MGWIKLDRKILDHWMWMDEPFTRGQAWVDLLLMANHQPTKSAVGGRVVEDERGTVCRSISFLATRWKWSRGKVERFLELLESDHMVELKRTGKQTSKRTVIFIVNYCIYQDARTSEQTSEQTSGEQVTSKPAKKEAKKEKKQKKEDKKEILQEGEEGKEDIYNKAGGEEDNARAMRGEAVLTFPLQDGEVYTVSDQDLSEYCSAYPEINVLAELGMLRQWCLSNPTKLKKNGRRFIANWLSRAVRDHQIAKLAVESAAAANIAAKTQTQKRGATFFDLLEDDAV